MTDWNDTRITVAQSLLEGAEEKYERHGWESPKARLGHVRVCAALRRVANHAED